MLGACRSHDAGAEALVGMTSHELAVLDHGVHCPRAPAQDPEKYRGNLHGCLLGATVLEDLRGHI